MTDPMTPERLAEIRERAQGATDGPWKVDEPIRLKDASLRYVIAAEAEDVASVDVAAEASAWQFHRKAAELDAEFIARAREDVPALLAEVERLRAELDARCDKDGCEQYREWLSGEKAEADKRARQAEAERDRLAEQVKRVREAHPRRDDPTGPVCGGCGLDAYEEPIEWPCPTIRALDGTETAS